MSSNEIAEFFKVWFSQDDWQTDRHKFYKSLGHVIHSASSLPDGDTVADALQQAYEAQYGDEKRGKFMLIVYSEGARAVLDYLRATR